MAPATKENENKALATRRPTMEILPRAKWYLSLG